MKQQFFEAGHTLLYLNHPIRLTSTQSSAKGQEAKSIRRKLQSDIKKLFKDPWLSSFYVALVLAPQTTTI
ncbi:MAG: hypothetical protein ACRCYZ_00940 [Alphaproteobacteria bacterium]